MLKLMGFSWAIMWRFMIITCLEIVAVLQIAINMEVEDPFGVLVGNSITNVALSFLMIFSGMIVACFWASKTSGSFTRYVVAYRDR